MLSASMPTLPHASLPATPPAATQRLLGTALAGLLCLASTGCSTKQETPAGSAAAGAAGMPNLASAGAATAGTANANAAGAPTSGGSTSAGGAGGTDTAGGTPSAAGGVSDAAGTGGASELAGAGGAGGAGGAAADPPHITSSTAAGVLTVEDFTALCDERGGTVEVMPHCGGFATAKGFSYDTGTQTLSEHTCMGANTCGGWNCITEN